MSRCRDVAMSHDTHTWHDAPACRRVRWFIGDPPPDTAPRRPIARDRSSTPVLSRTPCGPPGSGVAARESTSRAPDSARGTPGCARRRGCGDPRGETRSACTPAAPTSRGWVRSPLLDIMWIIGEMVTWGNVLQPWPVHGDPDLGSVVGAGSYRSTDDAAVRSSARPTVPGRRGVRRSEGVGCAVRRPTPWPTAGVRSGGSVDPVRRSRTGPDRTGLPRRPSPRCPIHRRYYVTVTY